MQDLEERRSNYHKGRSIVPLLLYINRRKEVDDTLKSISAKFLPNKTIAFIDSVNPDQEAVLIPLLEGKKIVNRKPTVYICENFTCKTPITTINELDRVLEKL